MINERYVYFLAISKDMVLQNSSKNLSDIKDILIFRPENFNPRIIAHDGWFTVHYYIEPWNKFNKLIDDWGYRNNVFTISIKNDARVDILNKLDIFGINHDKLNYDYDLMSKKYTK